MPYWLLGIPYGGWVSSTLQYYSPQASPSPSDPPLVVPVHHYPVHTHFIHNVSAPIFAVPLAAPVR